MKLLPRNGQNHYQAPIIIINAYYIISLAICNMDVHLSKVMPAFSLKENKLFFSNLGKLTHYLP